MTRIEIKVPDCHYEQYLRWLGRFFEGKHVYGLAEIQQSMQEVGLIYKKMQERKEIERNKIT